MQQEEVADHGPKSCATFLQLGEVRVHSSVLKEAKYVRATTDKRMHMTTDTK